MAIEVNEEQLEIFKALKKRTRISITSVGSSETKRREERREERRKEPKEERREERRKEKRNPLAPFDSEGIANRRVFHSLDGMAPASNGDS